MKNWEFYEKELKSYNFDFAWLYQEHKEPIVLTEDEKSLCKLLGRGWIARNEDNRLRWFDANIAIPNTVSNVIDLTLGFPQCRFDFIKWEDEEPWDVKVND